MSKITEKKDFDFICSLMESFFEQELITERLRFIQEKGILSWESWWQIEFFNFCESDASVAECYREERYGCDGRKGKQKILAIDFLIRKKGADKGEYIGVELKRHNYLCYCFSGMFDDIEKLNKIKETEDDLRSFWCIGVYPKKENIEGEVLDKINELCKTKEIDIAYQKTCEIHNTSFMMTIL